MDTELARTFLAVVAAGNFSLASSRLFVTQSTVSVRIATLERQLGARLFLRNRGGTTLTAAGRRFQSYATTLVRTTERARQDIGHARGFHATITIGGRFGLWEGLLLDCLPYIRQALPEVAVRAEIGFEEELMQGLIEARTDIGVMYTPQRRPGLVVEPLLEERLVLVGTDLHGDVRPGVPGYVYVDWGPEFASQHSAAFPEFDGAALSANIGWLGLQHILADGGCGYFPLRLAHAALATGDLQQVGGTAEFVLPAYVVHLAEPESDGVELAVQIIREVAAAVQSGTG